MTQLDIKRDKQSLMVVCSHRKGLLQWQNQQRPEVLNSNPRAVILDKHSINEPVKHGSAREHCRWAETGISFYRNKNTSEIPCIFIKSIWPKSLMCVFSASVPRAGDISQWKMQLPAALVQAGGAAVTLHSD